jgi:hypothetical protein
MKTTKLLPLLLIFLISGCHIVVEEVYSPASRLVGSYEVDEWSETLAAQAYFDIFIHDDPYSADIIYINNFYDSGIEVWAKVNGSRVYIPLQTAGPYEIEGNGTYYNGELNIDYSVLDLYSHIGFTDYCNAICLKY